MVSKAKNKSRKQGGRARNRPLLAGPGAIRSKNAQRPAAHDEAGQLMGEMIARYAELPIRLMRARTPYEFWQEQVRFVQSVTTAYQSVSRMAMTTFVNTKTQQPSRRKKRASAD